MIKIILTTFAGKYMVVRDTDAFILSGDPETVYDLITDLLPPAASSFLLLETGDHLLLETGDKFILE